MNIQNYKVHAYSTKRLSDNLTIRCDNLHELVIVQLLGIRYKWSNPDTVYVHMANYVKYLEDFNPLVDIPVFPMYISFYKGVFTKSLKFTRLCPMNHKIVKFHEFFTLKPEFYYTVGDRFNL